MKFAPNPMHVVLVTFSILGLAHLAFAPVLPVSAELEFSEVTHAGYVYGDCLFKEDREEDIGRGPITWVKVCHGGYIRGLQLGYGGHAGAFHGFQGAGQPVDEFRVPAGEKIVRVEGGIEHWYVRWLQFTTDRGTQSKLFGQRTGRPFTAVDPNDLPLRTIAGYFDVKYHEAEARRRACTSLNFFFGHRQPPVPVDDQTKVEYLRRYAPQVWLHSDELYWPSSVEWCFNFVRRYWGGPEDNKMWWLYPKEPLPEPSSTLPYFHGADPSNDWTDFPLKLEDVPAYAFWNDMPGAPTQTVDLVYFFFYPYNRGKSVGGTVYENHVGDWEHITVRLTQTLDDEGQPTLAPSMGGVSLWLAQHAWGQGFAWAQVPKVQGTEHPIIYSACGSHASYLHPGSHKYGSAAPFWDLADHTNARGTAWDTWKKIECFDHDAKKGLGPTHMGTWPNWLQEGGRNRSLGNEDPASGPIRRWGTYRDGPVGVGEMKYYRLEHGPTGPVDKPYFTTPGLD